MYALGKGVLLDDVYAYAWFNVSVYSGHKDAAEMKKSLAKMMTMEKIAEAQELSRELLEKIEANTTK